MTEEEYSDWQCPKCGWDAENGDSDPEAGQVRYDEKRYNPGAAIEHGGYCYDWVEHWTCQECGTEFEFENCGY